MQDSAIRNLAICDKVPIVAAGFFKTTVQVWSWKNSQQLGKFETIMDLGYQSLALTLDGRACITSSSTKGLAAYSIPDGNVLWHRKDIPEVCPMTFSATGRELYCSIEGPSVLVIEVETGASLGKIRRASKAFASQVGHYELIAERENRYIVRGANEAEIPAISFSLLSAAFSPDSVCLSEPKTGIRCVDLASASQLWHHEEIGSNHVAFNSSDQRFYCVAVAKKPPHDRSLVRLASKLLECEQVQPLGCCWEDAFSPSGELLVTKDGDVWQTSTGELLAHFDFPQRDYPDH